MKLRFWKKEERAEPRKVEFEDALLMALLGKTDMNREKALQIPTLAADINMIADFVASTPVKLYREEVDGGKRKTHEVRDDIRVSLLNDSTGDTMSPEEMWHAVVQDYFLGKGAYIYINRERGQPRSLHYVKEEEVSITEYVDPIFKDYDIYVMGQKYYPFDFIKVLRNTRNGAFGESLVKENNLVLSVAYNSLKFENALVKKGGNKKGFIESDHKLDKPAMDALKDAFRMQYTNEEENVIVLNDGCKFNESSNTSVEMQLNENKRTNASEVGKLLHISENLLNGTSATVKPEDEIRKFIKIAVIPVMEHIESALNKDLLMEKEKGSFYFAFDKKELLKGTAKERYETYKAGIESKVLTIDEARYLEDMEALGMDFMNFNISDVLYDVKTKQMLSLNTNKVEDMEHLEGGEGIEDRDQE